jgi:hypothetical protein
VLYGDAASGEVAGVTTDGFRIVVESYDPRAPYTAADRLPNGDALPVTWIWKGWEAPRWYPEIKPVFETMQRTFAALAGASATTDAGSYRSGTRPPRLREP